MMQPKIGDFISRVFKNDLTKRGVGGAVGAILVAAISEAFTWQSPPKS